MKTLVSFVLVTILCIGVVACKKDEPIGTIRGAEYEYMTIGDKQYEICTDAPVTGSDKDKLIGKIKNDDLTFHIFILLLGMGRLDV